VVPPVYFRFAPWHRTPPRGELTFLRNFHFSFSSFCILTMIEVEGIDLAQGLGRGSRLWPAVRGGRSVGYRHAMRFGAEIGPSGVRFRLWAPAARRVELYLDSRPRRALPMQAVGDGWFETRTKAARVGSRYRFSIDGRSGIPDPASRWQPGDVHGSSAVIDPEDYVWHDESWRGRPWHETVLYELHVGAFTPEGNFAGVEGRLDHLTALGVTAIELMPLADFPGGRNWGYDGVFPFAPDATYGTPMHLKRLIDAAHQRGMMMFLDVVYNHLGPEGNYLHAYAPQFFTSDFKTPWGDAIDFDRREVREFFIENALYWLEEYRFDGLRFDAVHAIRDPRSPDILEEIAGRVRNRFDGTRLVHLVLETDRNTAHYLRRQSDGRPRYYVAQWNDDIHHAFHVLATGEREGYYRDFAERPVDRLVRCLSEGFAFQGEPFQHWQGRSRGERSVHLPPGAFVSFLQNHDQVGNRAFGERIGVLSKPETLRALVAILLLAPQPPLLFMGEEWGATEPFLFFCDFHDTLAENVREGRRREFARFPAFRDPGARERIPDPNAMATFMDSKLDWNALHAAPHRDWLAFYRALIGLRHREITPRLVGLLANNAQATRFGRGGLSVSWRLGDDTELTLLANLSETDIPNESNRVTSEARVIYTITGRNAKAACEKTLTPWFVAWFLKENHADKG
jgi:malto-oligosyltrehalose trehalohydrolase